MLLRNFSTIEFVSDRRCPRIDASLASADSPPTVCLACPTTSATGPAPRTVVVVFSPPLIPDGRAVAAAARHDDSVPFHSRGRK